MPFASHILPIVPGRDICSASSRKISCKSEHTVKFSMIITVQMVSWPKKFSTDVRLRELGRIICIFYTIHGCIIHAINRWWWRHYPIITASGRSIFTAVPSQCSENGVSRKLMSCPPRMTLEPLVTIATLQSEGIVVPALALLSARNMIQVRHCIA